MLCVHSEILMCTQGFKICGNPMTPNPKLLPHAQYAEMPPVQRLQTCNDEEMLSSDILNITFRSIL